MAHAKMPLTDTRARATRGINRLQSQSGPYCKARQRMPITLIEQLSAAVGAKFYFTKPYDSCFWSSIFYDTSSEALSSKPLFKSLLRTPVIMVCLHTQPYCVLPPSAAASRNAISVLMPAFAFNIQESATRVTPRCAAKSVTEICGSVKMPSPNTATGCGGLCIRIFFSY